MRNTYSNILSCTPTVSPEEKKDHKSLNGTPFRSSMQYLDAPKKIYHIGNAYATGPELDTVTRDITERTETALEYNSISAGVRSLPSRFFKISQGRISLR